MRPQPILQQAAEVKIREALMMFSRRRPGALRRLRVSRQASSFPRIAYPAALLILLWLVMTVISPGNLSFLAGLWRACRHI